MAEDISLEFIGRSLLTLNDQMRDMRAKIDGLSDRVDGLTAEMHHVRDEMHEMRRDIREFKLEQRDFRADLREVRTVVLQTDDGLRRIRGRVAELEAARA